MAKPGSITPHTNFKAEAYILTKEEGGRHTPFFKGYKPIEDSIVLTFRSDGRATGEAYVGFETPADSERAMALHRRTMGPRYIELFISNKEEQGRALQRFGSR